MTLRLARVGLLLLVTLACSEDDLSLVGAGELPPQDSIRQVVLEAVLAESFETGTVDRGFGTLLVAAHDFPDPSDYESRILLRFALALADTARGTVTVDSALIRLDNVVLEPDTVPFRLHRVTSRWEEDETTWTERAFGVPWATPGGDFDGVPVVEGRLAGDSTTIRVPDSLAQRWLDEPETNEGLILILDRPASEARIVAASTFDLPNDAGPRLDLFVTVGGTPSDTPSDVLATSDAFIATYEGEIAPGLGVGVEPRLRTVLRFEVDDVPVGANINLAELRLVPQQIVTPISDTLAIEMRRVASPFLGGSTVFANAALDTATVRSGEIVLGGPGLASLVRAWQADTTLNLGLGLTLERTSGALALVVLAGPDAPPEQRPRLRLIFTPPLEPELGRRRR